jgi:hypothetical protein
LILKTSLAVVLVLFLATSALLFSCAHPQDNTLAITHVTVIDMIGPQPLPDQTVLIEKKRIKNIGPSSSVAIPRGARVLDASGKFLVPGLVDMHVHLTAAGEPHGSRKFMLPLLLANGITSVRDMGGYLESLIPLRKEIEEGKRIGPSIVYAGPYLDGSPPSFEPSFVVTNRVQANEDVHQLVLRKVDFVKVQSMLGRDAYFAIAEAANRERIPFVGHVPDRVTAAEAADAGQHSVEHLTNVLRGCSRDEPKLMREQLYVPPNKEVPAQSHARIVQWQQELLDSYSQQSADTLIAKFRDNYVWQTPTLVLLKNNAFPTLDNSAAANSQLQFIPPRTLEIWERGRAAQMQFVTQPESDLRAQLFAKSSSLVGQMQKAGVKILAGTDSPAPYVVPGFALHHELELLVQAGLTPLEALQATTRNPAEFLGATKDSGTIATGKFADLVLLDANPLEDIRNTRKIRGVILRSHLLDRPALDRLLSDEEKFASPH